MFLILQKNRPVVDSWEKPNCVPDIGNFHLHHIKHIRFYKSKKDRSAKLTVYYGEG